MINKFIIYMASIVSKIVNLMKKNIQSVIKYKKVNNNRSWKVCFKLFEFLHSFIRICNSLNFFYYIWSETRISILKAIFFLHLPPPLKSYSDNFLENQFEGLVIYSRKPVWGVCFIPENQFKGLVIFQKINLIGFHTLVYNIIPRTWRTY